MLKIYEKFRIGGLKSKPDLDSTFLKFRIRNPAFNTNIFYSLQCKSCSWGSIHYQGSGSDSIILIEGIDFHSARGLDPIPILAICNAGLIL